MTIFNPKFHSLAGVRIRRVEQEGESKMTMFEFADEAPTFRDTVYAAATGQLVEEVTEGADLYDDQREWASLSDHERSDWVEYIEGVHRTYVRAREELSGKVYTVFSRTLDLAVREWDSEVQMREDLLDILSGHGEPSDFVWDAPAMSAAMQEADVFRFGL